MNFAYISTNAQHIPGKKESSNYFWFAHYYTLEQNSIKIISPLHTMYCLDWSQILALKDLALQQGVSQLQTASANL
jgi:hypothetical protein